MKIKKLNCPECGAAKVSPYKGPYISCDYCGTLIDIDAGNWINILNTNKRQQNLEELHHRIVAKSRKATQENNKEQYYRAQQEYWNNYYNIFPEFISPNVHKGEMFKAFLKAKAEWDTDLKFDDSLQLKKKRSAFEGAKKKFESRTDPHYNYLVAFMEMMEAYSKYVNAEIAVRSTLPKYEILNEIYPTGFEYKMDMAILAQPYFVEMGEVEIKHYLKKFNFEYEYAEAVNIDTREVECTACKQKILAPTGAFRCICENCYEMNVIKRTINCNNCAMENTLPEKWSSLINCMGCGTEIKVVSNS